MKLVDEVYTVQLASTSCYLSYQNRTCVENRPVVRGASSWGKWTLSVEDAVRSIATLSAGSTGQCPNGTLSRLQNERCKGSTLATGLKISGPSGAATAANDKYQRFQLRPIAGSNDRFHIIATGKASNCARFLAAVGCDLKSSTATELVAEGNKGAKTEWRLKLLKSTTPLPDLAPNNPSEPSPSAPSPSPMPQSNDTNTFLAPPPQPSQPPIPLRAPTIASFSPLITTLGYVEVMFPDFGGCAETRSFQIEYGVIGQVQSVEVSAYRASLATVGVGLSLPTYGVNFIVAVGVCSDGSKTARSNVLIVQYSAPVPPWTLRISAANYEWDSVTWGGPAPGLFVAVARYGNRVMTSPDGINWTLSTGAADNEWFSVTWGGPAPGLFVAVGRSGVGNRVMTSPDGITWTTRTSAADSGWTSVTWGPGLFVAVASNGQVMTSPDGTNWTLRSIVPFGMWWSVTWGGPAPGLFVAVAQTGTDLIMTSPDGINWTAQTTPSRDQWVSVTWGGPGPGLFVAVAKYGPLGSESTGNRVMTSSDGINWTLRTSPVEKAWRSVTWGGPFPGLFVAVAKADQSSLIPASPGNRVMTSPNGINWTLRPTPADDDWYSVIWGGPIGSKLFVAVSQTGTVMTSYTGA